MHALFSILSSVSGVVSQQSEPLHFSVRSFGCALFYCERRGLVSKKYIAIIDGKIDGSGQIEGYIRRKDESVMLREFSLIKEQEDQSYALTLYTSLSANNDASLLEIELKTGRTHQIRVSFASIGHPVRGDSLYGNEGECKRQLLHAYKMSFIHPFTGKQIFIEAPIPQDIKLEAEKKGLNYAFG